MATKIEQSAPAREPLTKERILQAAVALADEGGVDSLSMRKIALELGVVPMALYKHVANKDEMLDGMVDVVVGEIDPPLADADWKTDDPRAGALGPPGAPAPPLGLAGDRVADQPDADGDRVHGLDDRDPPERRLLDRPDPPRDARDGQPAAGVLAGAVRRLARRPARGPGDPGAMDGRDVPEHLRDGRGDHATTTPRSSGWAATISSSSSSRST